MPDNNNPATYTYRNGKKVDLYKKSDEFVVRTPLVGGLPGTAAVATERVSPASTRMNVPAAELERAMTESRAVAPTHHAYYQTQTDQSFDITDRILVTFRASPSDAALDTFVNRYALRQLARYSDTEFLFQLTNDTGINPVKLVVALTEDEPDIAFAEHDLNMKMRKFAITLPLDPNYIQQWHLHTHTATGPDFDPRSSARCEEAWQLLDSYGRPEVVIGLSDDGCKLDHPDFDSPGKFAGWGYFQGNRLVKQIDADANPALMHVTGANHGTSCAGVIGGECDGVLTVGAAPGCKLLPIKWESDGPSLFISDSKLFSALNYVKDKVDVFSNSWGMSPESNHAIQVVNFIDELSKTGGRRGKGIVFLWAAGNENCPVVHSGNDDVPFNDGWAFIANAWRWVGVDTSRLFEHNLASLPGVMYIAALAGNAQRSHYSNYGTGIALCAPSSNSHAYFRMQVRGKGIVTADGENPFLTMDFGGTSSATPLTAGIAGLVISANPNLTAAEVISILKQTASKDLNFSDYAKTPPASFDVNTSWDISPVAPFSNGAFTNTGSADGTWSPWFGFGKVDAFKAVQRAIGSIVGTLSVRIQSALINPNGIDDDKEEVTLKNMGAQDISVAGWRLVNQSAGMQSLAGNIPAGGVMVIRLESDDIVLRNTGGTLALLDDQGREKHKVSYTGQQVKKGMLTLF
nr:S8 family serine peptidase [uncultured Dyadobacter sp.]